MKKIFICGVLLLLCTGFAMANGTQEEEYPNRDITMVIPVKAGGDTDTYGRILAQYMGQELDTNIAVENIDGATGTIGGRQVYNARPDGYTLLFFHDAAVIAQICGLTDIKLSDYKIVSVCIQDPNSTFVVNAKKYKNAKDFFTRASSGEQVIVSAAAGSLAQLCPVILQEKLHANFKYVDSTSASDRIADMLAGRIDLFFSQYGIMQQYVQNGDFVSLGIMADKRNPAFSDVPTLKEQGYDIVIPKIFYIALPPKTPDTVVNKLSEALKKTCDNKDMLNAISKFKVIVNYTTPSEALDIIQQKEQLYQRYADKLI
ncbi:MAG: tripartite tricarboxylate transporter substrate binding protein [Spirochaetia bacterium]|jgi:tripartite-type tricarboxylate transporter receptor subunit TctC|nr:tripartite tricarboxylate transporter substrate binding protein [Spirochaetia bacterium]